MEVKKNYLGSSCVLDFCFFCLKEDNFQGFGYERNMKNVSSKQLKVKSKDPQFVK